MFEKFVPKSQFFKNVLMLMTGTSIAQAVPIALSPILTRIYSPEDFGLFALYMGIAAVLGVIATGRYELAILLPEKDEDAADIVKLASFISLFVSLFVLIVIIFLGREIAVLLGNEDIYVWLYFLPISMILTGVYQSLNYWFNRKGDFKRLAGNRIIQSVGTGFTQLPLGVLNISGLGLVIGQSIGQIFTVSVLTNKVFSEPDSLFRDFKISKLHQIGRKFINFPKYDVPTSVLNAAAMHAPNILFTTFYSSIYSGFFFLMQRVLQVPVTLISTSILDVFKEEASKSYRETGNSAQIYLKTFKWLVIISIIPSLLLYFSIENLFVFFFGDEWGIAGRFAKIMIPALALRFISSPLSFMIYIAEKQFVNFVGMALFFIGTILSFLISNTPEESVIFLNITMFCYYSVYLIISSKIAKVW